MREERTRDIQRRIEEILEKGNWKIYEAISYTPEAGGKKLRAGIMLSVAEDLGIGGMLDAAVAVELFHSGTLIHDDMPEVDNATMRRGKPANHKVFGPGIALLAGDGLFFLAFRLISNYPPLFPHFSRVAYEVLIGEAMDVELEEKKEFREKDIYDMYEKKTGALFGFSMSAPMIMNGGEWKNLEKIGRNFGVAFQVYDDMKDFMMNSEDIGKDVRQDIRKKTLIKILGEKKAKELANSLMKKTIASLESMGLKSTVSFLREASDLIVRG